MPTTTTQGYRIPLDSDPVADTALAMRNLAQDVDDKLGAAACGSAVVAVAAAAQGSQAVVFPVGRFSAAPIVTATVNGASNLYYASVNNVTAAGCDVKAVHKDGAVATNNITVNWIALQQ